MRLYKPEYSENVVDVDGLEKARIAAEAQTEQETIKQQEETKRCSIKEKEETKRSNEYKSVRETWTVGGTITAIVLGILACVVSYHYQDVAIARYESMKPVPPPAPAPVCPKCPETVCAPVPKPQ